MKLKKIVIINSSNKMYILLKIIISTIKITNNINSNKNIKIKITKILIILIIKKIKIITKIITIIIKK